MVPEMFFVILSFQSSDSEILSKKEIEKNRVGVAGQLEYLCPNISAD